MATFCGLRSVLRLHRFRRTHQLLHQNHTNRDLSNQRPPSPTYVTSSPPRSSTSVLNRSHFSATTHDRQAPPRAKGDGLHTATFESNDRHERLGIFAFDGTGHSFHLNNVHSGFGLDTGDDDRSPLRSGRTLLPLSHFITKCADPRPVLSGIISSATMITSRVSSDSQLLSVTSNG